MKYTLGGMCNVQPDVILKMVSEWAEADSSTQSEL